MNPNLSDLLRYAESFLGVPYIYGGNHRVPGLDCSGFICEILRSVGVVGKREDLSALELYKGFSVREGSTHIGPHPITPTGALLFYGKSVPTISHVALVVSPYSVIECGGGDHTTITVEIANQLGAGVRKSWIGHRTDKLAAVYPPYPWE